MSVPGRAGGPLGSDDLQHVLAHTAGIWEPLRGQRLFLSGGTGFFGIWLVESFLHVNERLGLGAQLHVLSREPQAFLARAPHLAGRRALRLHRGDMTDFRLPRGRFAGVIHGATEPAAGCAPLELFERNVEGTRRLLELARRSGAARFLFVSSGAVYGRQPSELTHIAEEYAGAPDVMAAGTAYGQSKRASEFLCAAHARRHGLIATSARCFAFVGPHLPLASNFAVGNFIRDALAGGPIRVSGDGTPRRSYLYAADLAIWLWTILLNGASERAYNVGSEAELSIAALARTVAAVICPTARVEVGGVPVPGAAVTRYVPAAGRARRELGLTEHVALAEGIRRTAAWHAGAAAASAC